MNTWILGFFFLAITWIQEVKALPIDEKLPLRIIKISESKKTMLINRGIEDGLVVGDHAKFFLTTGVVARGVLVKAAPGRSIWSLYRIVNADELADEKVMNLKIASAVKLSNDPTKMFEDEELKAVPAAIALADETDSVGVDPNKKQTANDKKMETLEANFTDKTSELWGIFQFNSLQASNVTGNTSTGTKGTKSTFDFTAGYEKYFNDVLSWYSRISLAPFFHYVRQNTTTVDGQLVLSDLYSVGAQISWHFLASPMEIKKWMLFASFSGGVGMGDDVTNGIPSATPTLNQGLGGFWSMGLGSKYYFTERVGLRALLDFYYQSISYKIEGNPNLTQTLFGPRFLFGLSYRF